MTKSVSINLILPGVVALAAPGTGRTCRRESLRPPSPAGVRQDFNNEHPDAGGIAQEAEVGENIERQAGERAAEDAGTSNASKSFGSEI